MLNGQDSNIPPSRKGDNADLMIDDEFFGPAIPVSPKQPGTAYGGKRNRPRQSNMVDSINNELSSPKPPRNIETV